MKLGYVELSILLQEVAHIKSSFEEILHMLPNAAWVNVTEKCNLRCKWCYGQHSFSREHNMPFEQVESILRHLKSLNIKTCILIGGEPTIHPDIRGCLKRVVPKRKRRIKLENKLILQQNYVTIIPNRHDRCTMGINSASITPSKTRWSSPLY
ncbi:MAG: radical SAM protein [Coleofasciculaceae cyanobacterium SM2_1_6]|nr:radical SAM protein [Coleofasciculaceae cyanobacterium SM2_1_6]